MREKCEVRAGRIASRSGMAWRLVARAERPSARMMVRPFGVGGSVRRRSADGSLRVRPRSGRRR